MKKEGNAKKDLSLWEIIGLFSNETNKDKYIRKDWYESNQYEEEELEEDDYHYEDLD